ncbi:Outer membrane protein assembly factor BamD [Candidatus Westeberhardia cardiocondylae]|uniref:Outer membrane protein assembly factor BamD n=1 Tax=Candidatus Westeberhardia cardiocondylae TaxID=1594731 RepID=A0A0H5BX91_9ENTR|nr:Outer membrane protein assembly factor BamD [Candidatus Westeberhardia cardiocondylae]
MILIIILIYIFNLIFVHDSYAIFNYFLCPDSYFLAKKKLNNGYYDIAISEFLFLKEHCLCRDYKERIKLDLVYAYYKIGKLFQAKMEIDNFLYSYFHSCMLEYVLYMRGLINVKLDYIISDMCFSKGYINENFIYAKLAFLNFTKLVSQYPNTKYLLNVDYYLFYLKEKLSKNELSIIEFYDKKCAYTAVINRVEGMLFNFYDMQSSYIGLLYMEKAYRKLGLCNQADKIMNMIVFY